jgi:hypothetical protein
VYEGVGDINAERYIISDFITRQNLLIHPFKGAGEEKK